MPTRQMTREKAHCTMPPIKVASKSSKCWWPERPISTDNRTAPVFLRLSCWRLNRNRAWSRFFCCSPGPAHTNKPNGIRMPSTLQPKPVMRTSYVCSTSFAID